MTKKEYLKQWTKDELQGLNTIKKIIPIYLALYSDVNVIDKIPFIDKVTNKINYWFLVNKLPNNKLKPRYRKGDFVLYY